MQRYLETLFRHKALFLIPLIAIPALTTLTAFYTARHYTVSASAWSQYTIILPDDGSSRRVAPNVTEAQVIRDRLKTDSNASEVMDRVGLADAIRAGEWPEPTRLQRMLERFDPLRALAKPLGLTPPETVREARALGLRMIVKSLTIITSGDSLIRIAYAGPDPALGQRIIEETLAIHQEKGLETRLREAEVGVDYLTEELQLQEQRLGESDRELADFEDQFPPSLLGLERPAEELKAFQRFRQQRAIDEARYLSALDRLEDLRLRSISSISTAQLRFRIVDPPVSADARSRVSPRTMGLMVVVGLTLGLILGSIAVVFATWRDGTVRSTSDLERAIDAPLIVELPVLRSSGKRDSSLIRSAIGVAPWASEET